MTKSKLKFAALATSLLATGFSATKLVAAPTDAYILTDQLLAREINVEPLASHSATGTVLLKVSEAQREALGARAHEHKRCGGHELVQELLPKNGKLPTIGEAREYANGVFKVFDQQLERDAEISRRPIGRAIGTSASTQIPFPFPLPFPTPGPSTPPTPPPTTPIDPSKADPVIAKAVSQVSESNIQSTVDFLSALKSRDHKNGDGQKAAQAFKSRVEDQMKLYAKIPYTVELVAHNNTPMNSVRLTFKGSTRPDEVVVAGGHLDSINQSFFGNKEAPGADDNASGSANILETARIVSQGAQPSRTVEFYWYAGEEGGLLGSAEIAAAAKASGKKIFGVLQLDMTLFPGSGEQVIGSMTDFTSQDMRDLLRTINQAYIGGAIVEDKCGYGCSDHASWYKNGYPTLMPFETRMNEKNSNLHTADDRVDSQSSFKHAVMFNKIAVAFVLSLAK